MILEQRTDIDWLRLAFTDAARYSDDPHTQNGAVIVPTPGNEAWSVANHIPAKLQVTSERLERPAKYRYIEHAERAAIFVAARMGTPTEGATLYCCWFACPECARAIIISGVREVVGHVLPRTLTPERWEADVALGESMLREAGVSMRWLADPVGVTIKFDGRSVAV